MSDVIATTISHLPSPHEHLRVVGRGQGWGAIKTSRPPTPVRIATAMLPTLPTASRGEGKKRHPHDR
jgi:hypothetical protein